METQNDEKEALKAINSVEREIEDDYQGVSNVMMDEEVTVMMDEEVTACGSKMSSESE